MDDTGFLGIKDRVKGKCAYGKKNREVTVSHVHVQGTSRKTHEVVNWSSNSTAEIILLCPLSSGPEKSSGLQLVEWAVDICMLQQIFFYKLAMCYFQL